MTATLLAAATLWMATATTIATLTAKNDHSKYNDTRGPTFIHEPENHVQFSNETGVHINCTARGSPDPTISWLRSDGSPVPPVQSLRRVQADGTLVFPPFRAQEFQEEIHASIYKCIVSNKMGTIVSRDVNVHAVISQQYDIQVQNVHVIRGNTAVFKCILPKSVEGVVAVVSWIRNSFLEIQPSLLDEDKYLILPSGDLHIQNTGPEDDGAVFQCKTKNRLTGGTRTSVSSGRLSVADPMGNKSPKITDTKDTVRVKEGETAVLPCVTQGVPTPITTWFGKVHHEQVLPLHMGTRLQQTSGALVISDTMITDSGAYICVANNSGGADRAETALVVTVPLAVNIHPSFIVIDVGSSVTFTCDVTGIATVFTWLKNAKPVRADRVRVISPDTIRIDSVQPEDRGMYQCIASNGMESAQGTAELRLGDSKPDFRETFTERIEYAGSAVSLICVTTGSPTPNFNWTLDGVNITNNDRTTIVETADENGYVVSTMNISNLSVEDGGLYACRATNRIGTTEHIARLNIYGPPKVRSHMKISAVAGERSVIHCPSYGYPIQKYAWEKDGVSLPDNIRQTVFPNGTLTINEVRKLYDGGKYTCIVKNAEHEARGDVEVVVLVPPKIAPFSFQEELLREGMRARLQCVVSEGDLPLTIRWLKDGGDLPLPLGVLVRDLDEFSSILTINSVIPRHNGNYTCVVANYVATVHSTAELYVNVPPKIVPFSFQDDHLFEGMLVRVSCVVSRGDLPLTIRWTKDGALIPPSLGVTLRDFDEYSSVLSIESVAIVHNGNYTCFANNSAGKASHTAQLLVNVPPRWVIQPKDVAVLLGREVTLNCQADGFPKPNIKWMKAEGGSVIQHKDVQHLPSVHVLSNGSLFIKHASEAHRGQYFCIANNGVGGDLSKAVSVNVNIPVSFHTKYQAQSAIISENTTLTCSAKGELPITFNWTVDTDKSNRYIFSEGSTRVGRVTMLTILSVEREDTGSYRCFAKNEFGSDETIIELTVKESPEPPTNLEVNLRKNQKVYLTWTVPYDGNSPIVRYIVQYKVSTVAWNGDVLDVSFDAKDASGTISNLHPATTYNFRVLAENDIGVSEPSDIVSITTEEEAPGGPPLSVKVEALDSVTLKVTWKSPREDLLHGVLRGYQVGYKSKTSNDPFTFHILEIPANTTPPVELSLNLTELRKYTAYHVVVAAYNNKGRGPLSPEFLAMTAEDIPSKPPQEVRCSTLTSQNVYVTWQPPPPNAVNGVLLGYKVYYTKSEDRSVSDTKAEPKTTSGTKMTIVKLERFTNYSIQVLAFTKVGDGVKSDPIFCKTLEDVPGPPSNIRVLPASGDSVLVVWKPPVQMNGIVTRYTVYCKNVDVRDARDEPTRHTVSSAVLQYEIRRLRRNRRYEFWVTAATGAGEGQMSRVITQSPASNKAVPAAVASFDDLIITNWKEDLLLPCRTVGVPTPERRWSIDGKTVIENSRIRVLANGTLSIVEIQGEDEGNYTCKVENDHGLGEVKYQVVIQAPPSIASFEIASITTTSITVHWRVKSTGGHPIQGFILHYKRHDEEEWERVEISPSLENYTLDMLRCGTKYQLYLVAFSKVGVGNPTETQTVTTEGTIPTVPPKVKLIEESTKYVTLWLESWFNSGDCPIKHFAVEYRVKTHHRWTIVAENVSPDQKKLVISGLLPATWYKLQMVAYNSAGSSEASYDFATLNPAGGTIPPEIGIEEDIKGILFYLDLRFIIAIAASVFLILLALALVIICICIRRGKSSIRKRKEKQIRKEESIQSRPNSWSKPRPDGTVDSFTRLRTSSQHIGRYVADSPDELASCATFELPSQHYRQMKTFGHGSSIYSGLPRGLASNTSTASSTVNLQTFVTPTRPLSDISMGYRSPVATSTPSSPRRIHMIDVPTPNGPGLLPCSTPPLPKDYEPIIRENGSIPREEALPVVPVTKENHQRVIFPDEGITRFSAPSFDEPAQDETAETTFIFENPLDETDHINSAVHGIIVAGMERKTSVLGPNIIDRRYDHLGESTRLLYK